MTHGRRALPVLMVALLAGCSDGGGGEPDPLEPAFEELALEATATTGVIRGVVVDEAIRPLADATVTLVSDGARSVTTGVEGLFGFSSVPPGTHFLKIQRFGYRELQQSVDVAAGVTEPPALRVLLAKDPSVVAFVQAQVFEGYIECTTSVLVLCGAPAVLTGQNLTNDRFAWDQYFADNATHLQAEMVWESTQALSPELYFEMEALNAGCENSNEDVGLFLNSTSGGSPIYATVNETEIDAWSIGTVCPIWVSIFSGGIEGTPVGVTLQQRFTMYFHTFHGYMPPSGWRFTVDGEPPQPPQ